MNWLNGKGTYLAGVSIMLAAGAQAIDNLTGPHAHDWNEIATQFALGFGMLRIRRAVGAVAKPDGGS